MICNMREVVNINEVGLESKRISLDWSIFAANSLRDLGHGLVVVQHLGVLQLIEVVHDSGVGLSAPDLGHLFLMVS